MRFHVGTSGYAYKEWKGSFYPDDVKPAEMLAYYAGRLNTVEINNTFYRMPSAKVLAGWAEQVPADFTFVLKASRRITHFKRLKEAGDDLAYLLKVAGALGGKLGPVLFQLPPHLKKDVARLRDFVALLPADQKAVFEFRHDSWFDDETYEVLRAGGVALAVSDTGEDAGEPPIVPTARFGYLRLRRVEYGAGDLDRWVARIREQPWQDAYVFFKHEDEATGPRLAGQFHRLLAGA